MIRQLVTQDAPTVRQKAEALAAVYYPELIPDVDLEVKLLTDLRNAPGHHYAKVVGSPGKPVAALLARTGTNLWATRKHSAMMLWYSETPGAGIALLRDYRDWVLGNKQIQVAGLIDDFGIDARIVATLRREGFIQRGGAFLLFPRGEM